jgi:hypothetical protein
MMLTSRNQAQWGRRPRQTPDEWRLDTDGLAALAFFYARRALRESAGEAGQIPSRSRVLAFCRVALDVCAEPLVDAAPLKRFLLPSVPPPPGNKDDRIARQLLRYDPIVRHANVISEPLVVSRATFRYDQNEMVYALDETSVWAARDNVSGNEDAEDDDDAEVEDAAKDDVSHVSATEPNGAEDDVDLPAPNEGATVSGAAVRHAAAVQGVDIEYVVVQDVVVDNCDTPNLVSDTSNHNSPPGTRTSPRVGDKRPAYPQTPPSDVPSSNEASRSAGRCSSDDQQPQRSPLPPRKPRSGRIMKSRK